MLEDKYDALEAIKSAMNGMQLLTWHYIVAAAGGLLLLSWSSVMSATVDSTPTIYREIFGLNVSIDDTFNSHLFVKFQNSSFIISTRPRRSTTLAELFVYFDV